MRRIRWMTQVLRPLTVATLVLLAGPGGARAGVSVALLPASSTVAPGSEFELEIRVTASGSPFNGFDAIVAYDPAALTFLQASPVSLQQGCLMTGACSAACGNTFHVFSAAGDSLKVTDVLLCNQITLSGPGQIYKLRFKASTVAQVTTLTFRKAVFYDAGVYVEPVTSTGCTVGIDVTLDVKTPLPLDAGLQLSAHPNPSRGAATLTIESDAAGEQQLEVIDLLGRTIRRLSVGWVEGGTRHVEWDGRDASGARAPAGVYLIRLRVGDRFRQTRLMLLR